MAALLINPRYALFLWKLGLRSLHDFMSIEDGVLVGGHRHRDVRQLTLDQQQVFLKKEYVIPWKDVFINWLHGFGLVTKAGREWRLLHQLRELGFFAPEPIAYGERQGKAFLLLRALPMAVDLPRFLKQNPNQNNRRRILEQLADTLARFHNAGFVHADLYAKHVFIGTESSDIGFVDYQRTRFYPRGVPSASRWRDLASLSASLHASAVSSKDRLRFFSRYCRQCCPYRIRDDRWTAIKQIQRRELQLNRRNKMRKMHHLTDVAALSPSEMPIVSYYRVRMDATEWLPSLRVVQPHESPGEGT